MAFLKSQGADENRVFRALNCALVAWRTNRKIAARAPAEYIRERAQATTLGESEVRRRLESHLLDYDLLIAGDYDRFLRARAELMRDRARQLCT